MVENIFNQAFSFLLSIQSYINKNKLFDTIPLDIVCHILVSFIFITAGSFFKFKLKNIIFVLFVVEIGKEIFDSHVIGSSMTEHLKDILVTFIYPCFVVLIRKVKKE